MYAARAVVLPAVYELGVSVERLSVLIANEDSNGLE